jgi:hypothetical protein
MERKPTTPEPAPESPPREPADGAAATGIPAGTSPPVQSPASLVAAELMARYPGWKVAFSTDFWAWCAERRDGPSRRFLVTLEVAALEAKIQRAEAGS